MLLHHQFITAAKKMGSKMAIVDKTTGNDVPYARALIASLILAKKFSKYPEMNIGVMIPTSAGSMLTVIGLLMAGKAPAMINYSTGAAGNCVYAQDKCGFKTIITSRALLENNTLRRIDGEDQVVKEYYVFVANDSSRAERRVLDVVYINHKNIAVQGGVDVGDRLVVTGQNNLRQDVLLLISDAEAK